MRVVILHYHLHPGGVTRIIESQVRSITAPVNNVAWCVLSGSDGKSSALPPEIIHMDRSLFYHEALLTGEHFSQTIAQIVEVIKESLSDDTILHCHNPNLGKNPALTAAVYQIAREGYAVVNHCHDFAEDRPANLQALEDLIPAALGVPLAAVLYPDFTNYHFIVLNSCDHQRILDQGISSSRVHLLPNPVVFHSGSGVDTDPYLRERICKTLGFNPRLRICTYPVRAIARKNLGEFILLYTLFADKAHFTVTQPPKNPLEMPGYAKWLRFCQDNKIDVKFESGNLVNHEELINISDFCLTTSMREGFGMAFLESWLAGTPVIGRDIPCVTNDLRKAGINFPRLYSGITVKSGTQVKDFKDFTAGEQEEIIKEVLLNKSSRSRILKDNPFLRSLLDEVPAEMILMNQVVVKNEFSIEKYGEKLLAIYRDVSE